MWGRWIAKHWRFWGKRWTPTAGNAFDIRQPGEPNFEWTDLDESDMIGLTSFAAPNFGGNNRISKDDYIYTSFMNPGQFDS